ncbi:hypothetical protein QQS21_007469 [Conoideocrella luteorostrata]|uniref:Arginine metabolism regulation protein II n=1 Tax=Conoideocrella luteorostrata TaxID=1105319 RepID=A0AAJ0CKQ1_9HYPO|nr:hypothetical protein QQS21_007469 [Conoideocrella luteorostrata]
MCRLSRVRCGGYDKRIFFASEDGAGSGSMRFRRPLLSEKEREQMCKWITSRVPPQLALWHIASIDEECEEALTNDIQISHGPFGAFRLHSSSPSPGSKPPSTSDSSIPSGLPISNSRTQQPFDEKLAALPGLEVRAVEPSPVMGVWGTAMLQGPDSQDIFDRIPALDFEISPGNNALFQDYEFPTSSQDWFGSSSPKIPQTVSIAEPDATPIPGDAVHLLKHYTTTVLAVLTPFRHSKTPWHVLFVPHAKNTLAALTMGESVDYASLCAFHSILSISAISLSSISRSQNWLVRAKEYDERAQEYAQLMLLTAYNAKKTAKYKSILIALLTMVQISMITGDRDKIESYFLETEKFIRLKGLNRRKSRKVRLLHHCYAFDRVLYESSCIDDAVSSRRLVIRESIESSDAASYSQDSLSFRLGSCDDLDQQMLTAKGKEEGENDLHLQIPGIWSATLYPEIFGIPEIQLFLLSLVIRLGKEKELAEQQDGPGVLSLKEFMRRARSIERWINRLQCLRQVSELAPDKQDEQMMAPQALLDNLLTAMQQALTIYFYRRIYDIEPGMLQQNVVAVRDCLLRVESADNGLGTGCSRFVWPAYVAACEAQDPALRASFSSWFKESARRSGFRFFMLRLWEIERLWASTPNSDPEDMTWLRAMRKVGSVHESKDYHPFTV